jgi:two-component SAPR family response regulator
MPHQSGTDFLREARALCPGVPGLLITGYAEADMIRDKPDGIETLLKPFTPAVLDTAVAKACKAKVAA